MEGVASASALQDQFLNLLVTQLRHQDPLEPTKQEDFLGQLAQFATVEGIENLNTQIEELINVQGGTSDTPSGQWQTIAAASNLIGRSVEYTPAPENADETDEPVEPVIGNVEAVVIEKDEVSVRVDGTVVPLTDIREILDAA